MNIAVITGASSGLGVQYAKTVIDLYPRGFYKGYRFVSKVLPSACMIKIVGKSFD